MKGKIRIIGGLVLTLALLAIGGNAAVFAQGPMASATPNGGAACTDVATFVSDVTVPDLTVVTARQAFSKTWRMRNRGTCAWGQGYALSFVSGQAMTTNPSIPIPETAPAAAVDLSVPMVAPAATGAAQGFWQLQSPNGTFFGPRIWALVTVGTPAGRVLAAAPPLAASNTNVDDPARAQSFGSAIASLSPGTAQWLQFTYNNKDNALPRPTVTVQLLNGFTNGLAFEVYSPETMVNNDWFHNKPVGRGTREVLAGCSTSADNSGLCSTNNLSWTGGFGLNGTYYVRMINNTGATVAPQIIVGGTGLAQCAPPPGSVSATSGSAAPFSQIQCTDPNPGAPPP